MYVVKVNDGQEEHEIFEDAWAFALENIEGGPVIEFGAMTLNVTAVVDKNRKRAKDFYEHQMGLSKESAADALAKEL